MNAIKFIKLYGLNSARVTVEDAQENTHYCTEAGYQSTKLDVAYEPCPDCVSIPDLKRLVESVDFINKFGGIDLARAYDKEMGSHGFDPFFEKAIADYESIYGGEHV